MNSRVKAGLIFGIVMAIFYIIIDLLSGSSEAGTKEIIKIILSGIIGGAIAGFLFGWLIGKFSNSKAVENSTKIETDPDEQIVFSTPANHFKGLEGVGGKLFLTNKRLIFKSHQFNIRNHKLVINLNDIVKVDKYKPFAMTNNGLMIKTNQLKTEKFVVEKREDWLNHLN